ncbi:MAG: type II toxin-antitoxin system VapC family toxin [Desulfovermiculus sp.]
MILLDTNVVSEAMRPWPEPGVIRWLDALPASEVWISAVTVAEIRLGIALLPEGRRKKMLFEMAEKTFAEDFSGQCLPFDCQAAREYAVVVARRTNQGRPVSVEDAQIAAIALAGGLILATRNVKDFSGITGLEVVDPWLSDS